MATDTTAEVTPLPRSVEEIRARAINQSDMFGFEIEVLIGYLTFEEARPLLKADAVADGWDASVRPRTREAALQDMRAYMSNYGLEKCLSHRGLSANRTIVKMVAWAWLLGEDALQAWLEDDAHYAHYGAPMLQRVCETFGWTDLAGLNDPRFKRMAQGLPCIEGCEAGCGQGFLG